MNLALKVSASVSVEDYLEREKYCSVGVSLRLMDIYEGIVFDDLKGE